MEAPTPPTTLTTPPTSPIPGATNSGPASTTPLHISYADCVDSSPRSRKADSLEEAPLPAFAGAKLRVMCSYGGHIVPRPHDKSLCYVGGETRIVVVDRKCTLSDLLFRLSKIILNGRPFVLKYQLPSEDLDSLITVSTEEDLENMLEEYDRLAAGSNPAKSSRIRLFLFPTKAEAESSIGSILDGSSKSGNWFLDALNGTRVLQRGFSDPTSVDCLLGLEGNVDRSVNSDSNLLDAEAQTVGGKKLGNQKGNLDTYSVPDSPMIEAMSSFGSTSSSLANLPPVRVHVEESDGSIGGGDGREVRVSDQRIIGGIEEQFSEMVVGAQKLDDGFVMQSSPPTLPSNMEAAAVSVTGLPVVAGEYLNRIVSDDERTGQFVPLGYRKPSQETMPSHAQQKLAVGDLPSPDSVSSDSSLSNAISRQKPMIYQEPVGQIPSAGNMFSPNLVDPKVNVSDPNVWVQMPQNLDSRYALAPEYDHQQQQLHLQQQLYRKQQQQQQTAQPQQFIHPGPHFVHHPAGAAPLSTYYPLYPSQQAHLHHHPLDQRYPVYFVPAGQAQAFNLPMPQTNFSEAASAAPSNRPQVPPNHTMITTPAVYTTTRNMPPPKPEMAAGVYRTAAAAAPPLVQAQSGQPQPQQQQPFMGYSQILYPSQSIAPTYEYADPADTQLYFSQPLQPLTTQYQAMTSTPGMVLSDASAQLPTDNIKQQIRCSEPL